MKVQALLSLRTRWTSVTGLSTTEAGIGKRERTAELDPPVVHPVIGSLTNSEVRHTSRPVRSQQDSKEITFNLLLTQMQPLLLTSHCPLPRLDF